jgi:AraC family transcriptional regulator of adaptative response / DNA-3-methyladenine glycosylase II
MVGVDADADAGVRQLIGDPTIGPLVAARPGMRVPSAWGVFEAAVHTVIAQHCGSAEARERTGALVREFGQPVPGLTHGLTHLFPSAEVLASGDLAALGLPPASARAVHEFASGVAAGTVVLDSSTGLSELVASLTAIEGIGGSAAHQLALRLGHHDAFPAEDPHVRQVLEALDAPQPAEEIAVRWRPWRAVAALHLITHGASADMAEFVIT